MTAIQELEREGEFANYLHLLADEAPDEMLCEVWDMFASSCADAGVDALPYIRRAEAWAAAQRYGRSYDEVLADLQKHPLAITQSWCDPGAGCACNR